MILCNTYIYIDSFHTITLVDFHLCFLSFVCGWASRTFDLAAILTLYQTTFNTQSNQNVMCKRSCEHFLNNGVDRNVLFGEREHQNDHFITWFFPSRRERYENFISIIHTFKMFVIYYEFSKLKHSMHYLFTVYLFKT